MYWVTRDFTSSSEEAGNTERRAPSRAAFVRTWMCWYIRPNSKMLTEISRTIGRMIAVSSSDCPHSLPRRAYHGRLAIDDARVPRLVPRSMAVLLTRTVPNLQGYGPQLAGAMAVPWRSGQCPILHVTRSPALMPPGSVRDGVAGDRRLTGMQTCARNRNFGGRPHPDTRIGDLPSVTAELVVGVTDLHERGVDGRALIRLRALTMAAR